MSEKNRNRILGKAFSILKKTKVANEVDTNNSRQNLNTKIEESCKKKKFKAKTRTFCQKKKEKVCNDHYDNQPNSAQQPITEQSNNNMQTFRENLNAANKGMGEHNNPLVP